MEIKLTVLHTDIFNILMLKDELKEGKKKNKLSHFEQKKEK